MALPALLLPALFSAIPGLAGLLGGDPNKKLRKQANQLLGSQGQLTNQLYQQLISSPAFSQAQGAIAGGANQASNQLAQNLGARGIGTSGTGAILSSLTPSLVGSQIGQLRAGVFGEAQNQAQNQIEQQLKLLLKTQGPSPAQQGFAEGLNAFAPYLKQYLSAKFPNVFPASK